MSPRNREDSWKQHPGQLIFSPPLLSQDAARPWMSAQHPPMQQQCPGMQRKRLSIEKRRTIGGQSKICWCKASFIVRWFGQLMVAHASCHSKGAVRSRQRLVGMGNRCRQKRSDTDGNTKSKLPCCDEGRPRRGQSCQTQRSGNNGYCVSSWTEPLAAEHGPASRLPFLDGSGSDDAGTGTDTTVSPPLRIKKPRPLTLTTCEPCTRACLWEAHSINGMPDVRLGRPVRGPPNAQCTRNGLSQEKHSPARSRFLACPHREACVTRRVS